VLSAYWYFPGLQGRRMVKQGLPLAVLQFAGIEMQYRGKG